MNAALLLLLAAAAAQAPAPAAPPVRRIAVVVGANRAAAGRASLRFSYDDAHGLAKVLTELGQFQAGDVDVMEDPDPATVLTALDRASDTLHAAGGETLLLFYYSGHADEQALYPNGKALPFTELRRRLDGPAATVRIGIIDACSGGGWTQSKGLHEAEPFNVGPPLTLASEGSVLIASSSGIEKARESEVLGGSFFTHHFVAGLRGAADSSGDGRVTLTEAFAYARELTIRDSASSSEWPQHPSFAMNLRGRGELALTTIAGTDSTMVLSQQAGPLQVIQLDTGLIVLEAPTGPRTLHLAVAPGKYLIRRRGRGGTFVREITVEAGKTTVINEDSLELVGKQGLLAKQELPPDPLALPHYYPRLTVGLELSMASGSSPVFFPGTPSAVLFALPLTLTWCPTDRLCINPLNPRVSYRFGQLHYLEWIVSGGMDGWYLGTNNEGRLDVNVPMGATVGVRKWITEHHSLGLSLSGTTDLLLDNNGIHTTPVWDTSIGLGYAYHPESRWSLGVNLGLSALPFSPEPIVNTLATSAGVNLRFRLTESVTANAGASVGRDLFSNQWFEGLRVGFSWGVF